MWESVELHKAAAADKKWLDPIVEKFAAIGSIQSIDDVEVKEDATPGLNAPVTEIALITLKEGADREVFQASVSKLGEVVRGFGRAKGNWGGSWGFSADDQNKFYIVLGWDSLEVSDILLL